MNFKVNLKIKILIIIAIILFLLFLLLRLFQREENFTNEAEPIPIVIINYNSLYFLKNFIRQLEKYPNPIIIMDNKSTYMPIYDYYKELKEQLKEKIDIRLLDQNYGHKVYIQMKDTLPKVFLLSDPDLELHENMPANFIDILLNISNKHKVGKVGAALDISNKELFIQGYGDDVIGNEQSYWTKRIEDPDYILYEAPTDTTLCLVNTEHYIGEDGIQGRQIRIAGDFTVKHLPWYHNYIKNNIPQDEFDFWIQNNTSSSLLQNKNVKEHFNL